MVNSRELEGTRGTCVQDAEGTPMSLVSVTLLLLDFKNMSVLVNNLNHFKSM